MHTTNRKFLIPKAVILAAAVTSAGIAVPAIAGAATNGLHLSQGSAESIIEQIDGTATTYNAPSTESATGTTGKVGVTTTTIAFTPQTLGAEIPSATNIVLTGAVGNLTKLSFMTYFDETNAKRLVFQAGYDESLCKRFAGPYAKSWCTTHIAAAMAKKPVSGKYTNTYKAAYTKNVKLRLTLTTTKANGALGAEVALVITHA